MSLTLRSFVPAAAALSLAALAATAFAAAHGGMAVPEPVRVPAGHKVALETVGVGEITYECRTKDGAHAWVFAGPDAELRGRDGQRIGRYFGPPATWQAADGSAITGKQLAVAPGGDGNIPLQLVEANPATGAGRMQGVTHVQRLATRGGVAPATTCDASRMGAKEIVRYQADYVFWTKG
ncbi:DUF3455 domain-containing protein [Rubrivivax albus]|nr:DUF3455 domain-containing protein [Rubrivivax albus]